MSPAPTHRLPAPLRGLLLWLGLPLLVVGAGRALDPLTGAPSLHPLWAVPGVLAAAAGLGLARWAQLQRAMLGSPPDPRLAAGASGGFHADGAYRLCRHPEYVGLTLYLLGWSAASRSPSAAGLTLLLLPAWVVWVLLVEEPGLTARYGPRAAEWREETPLFPR
ncbi:MAG: methyltransferase, partial [bacterium]